MGCSKPPGLACPTQAPLSAGCFGCMYHYYECGAYITASSGTAKTIDQFTTDELLAEVKRRMG